MSYAIGIVEMYGFVAAITAADAAAKAADVHILAIDTNKPANAESAEVPLIVAIKIQGNVSSVNAAVEAAAQSARSMSALIDTHVIAHPTKDSQKMASRTSIGRDRVGHIPNNA